MSVLFQKLNFKLLGDLHIMDVLDILMVAYIIYMLIHLIRETRAEPLLKGILMIIIAMQVSKWLQLNTIYFVIKHAMNYGIIALIIIFQPELRRALEKMGHAWYGLSGISSEENVSESEQAIGEICKACASLSKTKTGAIIVIERETKLNDIVLAGVQLDSLVTSELLLNIFVVNTPLHDGAVIVRENRIMAATCVLPLTQREDIPSELGTRHRASIGMSEQADAVVIVVSEETGIISYALNGKLYRNQSPEALKQKLTSLFRKADSKKKSVNPKKLFFKKGANK